jgi:hypothetical protein
MSVRIMRSMCNCERGWSCLCDDLNVAKDVDGKDDDAYELGSTEEFVHKIKEYYLANCVHALANDGYDMRLDCVNRVFLMMAANWAKNGEKLRQSASYMRILHSKLKSLVRDWPSNDDDERKDKWNPDQFYTYYHAIFFTNSLCSSTRVVNGRTAPCWNRKEDEILDYSDGVKNMYCREHNDSKKLAEMNDYCDEIVTNANMPDVLAWLITNQVFVNPHSRDQCPSHVDEQCEYC